MKNIRNKITFNENSPAVAIDLFNRKFNRVKTEKTSDSQSIQLELAAGETKVFIFSENPEKFNPRKENTPLKLKKHTEITGKWKIKPLKQWIAGSNNIKIRETGFTETESELKDWSEIKEIDKNFSGEVLYSMDFRFEGYKKGHRYYIDLGAMDYAARIELNGKNTGTVLSRPFRSDITDFLREGRNILKIRATNSLANTIRSEETQQAWERNIGRSWPAISPPYHKRQLEFEELNTKGGLKGPVRIFEEQVR
jgi:hypothetical protein